MSQTLSQNYNYHLMIDPQKCIARKNKTTGLLEQCPHNKKYGCFCGKHGNTEGILPGVLRFDEDLDCKLIQKIVKRQSQNKILKLSELHSLGNYQKNVLQQTLTHYGLSSSGNKRILMSRLQNYYQKLEAYLPYQNKIKFLQQKIRIYLQNKNSRLRGPALYNRNLCNNREDFYSFELLEEIEDSNFFSYRDIDGFVYGFEIKSFFKLLETKGLNPYNRKNIPEKAVLNFKNLMNQEKNKKIILDKKEDKLSEQQIFNDRVLTIFQHIEALTSSVNLDWFMGLNSNQLKKFYRILEDIWNYRAELNQTQKYNIIKDEVLFTVTVNNFYKIKNINNLRNVLLTEIEKLVFTAELDSDKTLACYYVLTALCEISQGARESFPWLYQG